jgi:predicted GIY-YIG superfamily endonuclease
MTFHAYMLRRADDSFYVGHTDDLANRLAQHQSDGPRRLESNPATCMGYAQSLACTFALSCGADSCFDTSARTV